MLGYGLLRRCTFDVSTQALGRSRLKVKDPINLNLFHGAQIFKDSPNATLVTTKRLTMEIYLFPTYQIILIDVVVVAFSERRQVGDDAVFDVRLLKVLLGDPATPGLVLRPERVQEVDIAVFQAESSVRT